MGCHVRHEQKCGDFMGDEVAKFTSCSQSLTKVEMTSKCCVGSQESTRIANHALIHNVLFVKTHFSGGNDIGSRRHCYGWSY